MVLEWWVGESEVGKEDSDDYDKIDGGGNG